MILHHRPVVPLLFKPVFSTVLVYCCGDQVQLLLLLLFGSTTFKPTVARGLIYFLKIFWNRISDIIYIIFLPVFVAFGELVDKALMRPSLRRTLQCVSTFFLFFLFSLN